MTISSVGIAGLTQLIVRAGPEMAETALKSSSVLMADDSVLEKVEPDGGEWTATCFVPENHAVTILSDNDALPAGGADSPVQARQLPAIFFGLVTMGRAAADAAIGNRKATVKLFQETIKNRLDQMTRTIGRSIHGNSIAPAATVWTGTVANSTATVTFTDLSLFRPGSAYAFNDVSSGLVFTVRCTDVSYTSGVGGTASFINDVPNANSGAVVALTDINIAVGDSFTLRGAVGPGFGVAPVAATTVGFAQIAGTGSLHGVTNAALPGWNSMSRNAAGVLTQELLLGFGAQGVQFSGHQYTHTIMSPNLAAAYQAATNSTSGTIGGFARQMVDASSDKYSKGPDNNGLTVGGRPLIQDTNCPSGVVLFHNREFTKYCVWKKLAPDLQDGDKLQSRTNYSYDYQIDMRGNVVTNKRSTFSTVTGITAFSG